MPLDARIVPVNPKLMKMRNCPKKGIINEVVSKPLNENLEFPTLTPVFIKQQFHAYNCFLNYKCSNRGVY